MVEVTGVLAVRGKAGALGALVTVVSCAAVTTWEADNTGSGEVVMARVTAPTPAQLTKVATAVAAVQPPMASIDTRRIYQFSFMSRREHTKGPLNCLFLQGQRRLPRRR
jgi:hypothetical protein